MSTKTQYKTAKELSRLNREELINYFADKFLENSGEYFVSRDENKTRIKDYEVINLLVETRRAIIWSIEKK